MRSIENFFSYFGWKQDRQKIRNELENTIEYLTKEKTQLVKLQDDFRRDFMWKDHGETARFIKERFFKDIEEKEHELHEFLELLCRFSNSV